VTATDSIKLVCPDCRRENEAERIYCHDCGARLDRTPLASRRQPDDPDATQKRVKAMFDPTRAKIRLAFFKVSKVVLAACVLAALAELAQRPDAPARPKNGTVAPAIAMDLEQAVTYHHANVLQYSQQDVNAYLLSALKSKKKNLDKPLLDFEGAVVQFKDGECDVTTERSVFGYSLFLTTRYAIGAKDGKPTATVVGANIGRLPLHPELMKRGDFLVSDVWQALSRERGELGKLSAVQCVAERVVLTPRT
jgi:hypothetical protein